MNNKAFSKVGVLVVVLLLGVIAFVAFPKVKAQLNPAQEQDLLAAKPKAAPAQAAAPAPVAPVQAAAAQQATAPVAAKPAQNGGTCDLAAKPAPVVTPCGFCGKSTIDYVCNPLTKRWDAQPTGCVVPDGYADECTPGTKAEIPCGAFSTKKRVCTEKCAWSAWSACEKSEGAPN